MNSVSMVLIMLSDFCKNILVYSPSLLSPSKIFFESTSLKLSRVEFRFLIVSSAIASNDNGISDNQILAIFRYVDGISSGSPCFNMGA